MNRGRIELSRIAGIPALCLLAILVCGGALGQAVPKGWEFRFGLKGSEDAKRFSIKLNTDADGKAEAALYFNASGNGYATDLTIPWLQKHGGDVAAVDSPGRTEIGGLWIGMQRSTFRKLGEGQDFSKDTFVVSGQKWPVWSSNIMSRSSLEQALSWVREREKHLRTFEASVAGFLDSGRKIPKESRIEIDTKMFQASAQRNFTIAGENAWIAYLNDQGDWDRSVVHFLGRDWPADLVGAIREVDQAASRGKLARRSVEKRGSTAQIIGFPESGKVLVRLSSAGDAVPRKSYTLTPAELRRIDKMVADKIKAEEHLGVLIRSLGKNS